MSEKEFQAAVTELARMLGLLVYHTTDSRRCAPGFPDLVIAGPGGVLFRELKTATGKVSSEQTAWLAMLAAGGADCGIWRPGDLRDAVVSTDLDRIRRARR